jgi:hypothetical protein
LKTSPAAVVSTRLHLEAGDKADAVVRRHQRAGRPQGDDDAAGPAFPQRGRRQGGRGDIADADPGKQARLGLVGSEERHPPQEAVRQGLGGRGVEDDLDPRPVGDAGGRLDCLERGLQLEQEDPRALDQAARGADVPRRKPLVRTAGDADAVLAVRANEDEGDARGLRGVAHDMGQGHPLPPEPG